MFLCLLFSGICVFACSCGCDDKKLVNPLDAAPVIFSGRVVDIFEKDYSKQYVFVVERSWKGVNENVVTVDTMSESSMCGVEYPEGSSVLVFAHGKDGAFSADLCSSGCAKQQVDIWTPEHAIKAFGEGTVHAPVNYVSVRVQRQRWLLFMMGLTLLMPFVITILRRRKKA